MLYPDPQIFHHLKAIFVHVPKTAGTSVERSLAGPSQTVGGHTTALGYQGAFPLEFGEYFKFAVLRHPVDRFLSAYRYLRGMPALKALRNEVLHRCGTLERFVERLKDDPLLLDWIIHLMPQHRFVCDRQGNPMLDRFLRFESLDADWPLLCESLEIPHQPLPRLNPSRRFPVECHATDGIREWIHAAYEADFRLGGYGEVQGSKFNVQGCGFGGRNEVGAIKSRDSL